MLPAHSGSAFQEECPAAANFSILALKVGGPPFPIGRKGDRARG